MFFASGDGTSQWIEAQILAASVSDPFAALTTLWDAEEYILHVACRTRLGVVLLE